MSSVMSLATLVSEDVYSVLCAIFWYIHLVGSKLTQFKPDSLPPLMHCLVCSRPPTVSVSSRDLNLVFMQLTLEKMRSQSALE